MHVICILCSRRKHTWPLNLTECVKSLNICYFRFCFVQRCYTMHTRTIMSLCRHLSDKARLSFVDRHSLRTCWRTISIGVVNRGAEPYVVDMRSDVLTKPTPRMLQAMTQASLDDDVFREDRTTLGKWAHMEIRAVRFTTVTRVCKMRWQLEKSWRSTEQSPTVVHGRALKILYAVLHL